MKIQPLADRVLVKPAPAEEKTIGGIIIPDTAKEKPLQGEVIAVGNGTKDEAMVLKAGDTVLTMEAMKMQSNYKVNADCIVKDVLVNVGDSVRVEQALIKLKIEN